MCTLRPAVVAGAEKDVVDKDKSALLYTNEENGRCIVIKTLLRLVTAHADLQGLQNLHCTDHVGLEHDFIDCSVFAQWIPFSGWKQRVPDSYLGVHNIDKLSAEVCRCRKGTHYCGLSDRY